MTTQTATLFENATQFVKKLFAGSASDVRLATCGSCTACRAASTRSARP